MAKSHKSIVKLISIVLVMAFFIQELSLAAPAEVVTPLLGASKPIDIIAQDPTLFQAPSQFVTMREVHKGPPQSVGGQAPPFIIHIQDAHTNLSGQQNMAAALDEIMSKYKVSMILSEGGANDCSLTPIKSIAPKEVWERVAKSYLIQGEISGEEYLNLVSDHPMKIMGIEDMGLYIQSVENYGKLADKRQDILEYLKIVQRALDKLKNKFYPSELLDYEKNKISGNDPNARSFEASFTQLIDLAKSKGADLSLFPGLMQLASVMEKEKEIDFTAANLEQGVLIEEIAKRGGKEDLEEHLKKMGEMKDKKAALFTYFQNTLSIAKEKNIDVNRYQNLMKYLDYLKAFSDIDLDQVLDQLLKAEDKVYSEILGAQKTEDSRQKTVDGKSAEKQPLTPVYSLPSTDKDARLVRAIDRFIGLLKTAYNIQMTTKEFDSFEVNEPDFSTISYLAFINRKLAETGYFEDLIPYQNNLDEGKKALEAFYDSVSKRDSAFIENMEKIFKDDGLWMMDGGKDSEPGIHDPRSIIHHPRVAVLITGGYHTQNLKKLFKEKGYSYAVLTPLITSETNQKKYENRLLSPIRGKKAKGVETTHGEFKTNDKSLSVLDKDLLKPSKKKSDGVKPAMLRTPYEDGLLHEIVSEAAELALQKKGEVTKDSINELVGKAMATIQSPVSTSGARLASQGPVPSMANRLKQNAETLGQASSITAFEGIAEASHALRQAALDLERPRNPQKDRDEIRTDTIQYDAIRQSLNNISSTLALALKQQPNNSALQEVNASVREAIEVLSILVDLGGAAQTLYDVHVILESNNLHNLSNPNVQAYDLARTFITGMELEQQGPNLDSNYWNRLGQFMGQVAVYAIPSLMEGVQTEMGSRNFSDGDLQDLRGVVNNDFPRALNHIRLAMDRAFRLAQSTGARLADLTRLLSPEEQKLIFVMALAEEDIESAAFAALQVWHFNKDLKPGVLTPAIVKSYLDFRTKDIEKFRRIRGLLIAFLLNKGLMKDEEFSRLDLAARGLQESSGIERLNKAATLVSQKETPISQRQEQVGEGVIDETVNRIKAGSPVTICFVCTANMNRSAIAHILTEDEAQKRGRSNLEVVSGGLITNQLSNYDGKPLQDAPVQSDYEPALQNEGVDAKVLSDFKSQQITADKLSADLIVVASSKHREALITQFPNVPNLANKIVLFTQMHPDLAKFGDEMPDPQRGDMSKDQLVSLIKNTVVKRLLGGISAVSPVEAPQAQSNGVLFNSATREFKLLLAAWLRAQGSQGTIQKIMQSSGPVSGNPTLQKEILSKLNGVESFDDLVRQVNADTSKISPVAFQQALNIADSSKQASYQDAYTNIQTVIKNSGARLTKENSSRWVPRFSLKTLFISMTLIGVSIGSVWNLYLAPRNDLSPEENLVRLDRRENWFGFMGYKDDHLRAILQYQIQLNELIEGLSDPDVEIRRESALKIGNFAYNILWYSRKGGSPYFSSELATSHLIKALEDKDGIVGMNAQQALGRIASDKPGVVVPALISIIRDKEAGYDLRLSAAGAFHWIGKPIPSSVVAGLIQLLRDKDDKVRDYAAYALHNFGSDASPAVPELITMVKENKYENRRYAVMTLREIGADAAPAVPVLREALKDRDDTIRLNAAATLGLIGLPASPAIPDLIQMVTAGEEESDRLVVIGALVRIGPAGVSELQHMLGSPDVPEETKTQIKEELERTKSSPSGARLTKQLGEPETPAVNLAGARLAIVSTATAREAELKKNMMAAVSSFSAVGQMTNLPRETLSFLDKISFDSSVDLWAARVIRNNDTTVNIIDKAQPVVLSFGDPPKNAIIMIRGDLVAVTEGDRRFLGKVVAGQENRTIPLRDLRVRFDRGGGEQEKGLFDWVREFKFVDENDKLDEQDVSMEYGYEMQLKPGGVINFGDYETTPFEGTGNANALQFDRSGLVFEKNVVLLQDNEVFGLNDRVISIGGHTHGKHTGAINDPGLYFSGGDIDARLTTLVGMVSQHPRAKGATVVEFLVTELPESKFAISAMVINAEGSLSTLGPDGVNVQFLVLIYDPQQGWRIGSQQTATYNDLMGARLAEQKEEKIEPFRLTYKISFNKEILNPEDVRSLANSDALFLVARVFMANQRAFSLPIPLEFQDKVAAITVSRTEDNPREAVVHFLVFDEKGESVPIGIIRLAEETLSAAKEANIKTSEVSPQAIQEQASPAAATTAVILRDMRLVTREVRNISGQRDIAKRVSLSQIRIIRKTFTETEFTALTEGDRMLMKAAEQQLKSLVEENQVLYQYGVISMDNQYIVQEDLSDKVDERILSRAKVVYQGDLPDTFLAHLGKLNQERSPALTFGVILTESRLVDTARGNVMPDIAADMASVMVGSADFGNAALVLNYIQRYTNKAEVAINISEAVGAMSSVPLNANKDYYQKRGLIFQPIAALVWQQILQTARMVTQAVGAAA